MTPAPRGSRKQSSNYGPVVDHYLHDFHARMLEQHGIAYVCEHPEVLFDRAIRPDAGLDERLYGNHPGRSYDATGRVATNVHVREDEQPGGLAGLMNHAYRILNEIYAPHLPIGAACQGSSTFYRTSPKRTYGSPGRRIRRYG